MLLGSVTKNIRVRPNRPTAGGTAQILSFSLVVPLEENPEAFLFSPSRQKLSDENWIWFMTDEKMPVVVFLSWYSR